jgi:hypothetical protein
LIYGIMANTLSSPAIPESFSAQERFLVGKTEEAIFDGVQLERWCRDPKRQIREFQLNLNKQYNLTNKAVGYFGEVPMNGKQVSVMGVLQYVEFGKVGGANPERQLLDFVLGEFLPRAHWTYPDGYRGGFDIEQSIYRDVKGNYGLFPQDLRKGCIDWRKLGTEYTWSMLTVQIHDFVMQFGPYLKRFKEAACVVMHPDFVHITENPGKGLKLEITVGYPFVEFAPIPNNYGFGPGKFGSAVKLYTFQLTEANDIKVVMDFAAAPRCSRVFDFGKIPDPVYGGAALLRRLTFGLWDDQPFHDKLDAGMVTQHARVHQALMEGSAKVWAESAGSGGAS